MDKIKLKDKHNKDISVCRWIPKEGINIKGVVQISHGMAESLKRYDYFARILNDNGYIVYGHDHRGHGDTANSKEELGYLGDDNGFSLMIENLKDVNDLIRKENRGKKIILFGHSMGSFLSQRYLQIYGDTIDGLILSGSNGKPNFLTNIGKLVAKLEMSIRGKKVKSPLMDKLSFGGFNNKFKPTRTPYDWICANEDEVDKYIEDDYCGFICTTSFYYELINGILSIHNEENLKNINNEIPIYIFSGEDDPVGYFGKGVVNLYNLFKERGVKDLNYKLYKGGRHEMLNEKNKDEVIGEVITWLNKRY